MSDPLKILVTGGTGSFGKAFIDNLLKTRKPERIVIYSRDELKQWEMQQQYPQSDYPNLRFFLGDIRDLNRLKRAFENIDTVVHAAALKQVPVAEYNPEEFIKTNILGSGNIIQAALDSNVNNVVALSTDKAAAPVNLYGATKLCSDKLMVSANNIKGNRNIKFSVVRYGNVMGSRGSVIPYFINKAKEINKNIPITSDKMTRFNISLIDGVNMVMWTLGNSFGGEILIPKIPSYKITDLAEAIAPSCKKEIIGIREGEKIHEDLITSSESFSTIDIGNYYVILQDPKNDISKYKKKFKFCKRVNEGFEYNSGTNENFLSVSELRALIKLHVDQKFQPV